MPSSRHARMMRSAISPRFATRTLRIMAECYPAGTDRANRQRGRRRRRTPAHDAARRSCAEERELNVTLRLGHAADTPQQLRWDAAQKRRDRRPPGLAVQHAAAGAGEEQEPRGAGHADVEQPPLLV